MAFLLTLIWYIWVSITHKNICSSKLFTTYDGAISTIGVALVITSRWKISIHMLGIGGVIGAIIGISQRFQFDHSYAIMP